MGIDPDMPRSGPAQRGTFGASTQQLGESERFKELGEELQRKLGLSNAEVQEMRQQIRLALLGSALPHGDNPDLPEMVAALRYTVIKKMAEFPTISALADKAALAFSAFDPAAEASHQQLALATLGKSAPKSAIVLALVKACDTRDPDTLNHLTQLGRTCPLLQPLAAAYLLHHPKRALYFEQLQHALGSEKFNKLLALSVTDGSKPLDERGILNAMAPLYAEELNPKKRIELGRLWQEAQSVPIVDELTAQSAGTILMNILQRAAHDPEIGSCVAGALLSRHQEELLSMGIEKAANLISRLDDDSGKMIREHFKRLKEATTGNS